MVDPTDPNTPDNPAGGGSQPGNTEKKPEEGRTELPDGGKTHVLPPDESIGTRSIDDDAQPLPRTVSLKPGEEGHVEPPQNLSEVTGDDEGRETQTIGSGDVGRAEDVLGLGGAESTAAGGGNQPPSGGQATATGGDEEGDRFIEEMVRKLLSNSAARKTAGDEEKAHAEKCVRLLKEFIAKSKGKDDLVERMLLKCRSLKELIDDLRFAMRAGGNFSMSKLVDALVAHYAMLENQTLGMKKHRDDPVFAEAEAYLAANQNSEAEEFLANDRTT